MLTMPNDDFLTDHLGQGNDFVMMRMPRVTLVSEEAYRTQYWPQIEKAVRDVLTRPEKLLFSHEEVYRHVYNVCCQRHQVSVFNDLMALVNQYISQVHRTLYATSESSFLATLARHYSMFLRSTEIISSLFYYLDKSYVIPALKTEIRVVLIDNFNKEIFESPDLCPRLSSALLSFTPAGHDPALIMTLVKGLYALSHEFAKLNPALFSLFIPCLQPSRGPDVDHQETMELIDRLKHQGFSDRISELKRTYDDVLSM